MSLRALLFLAALSGCSPKAAGEGADPPPAQGTRDDPARAGAAAAECGAPPLPDCPLQGWMKANAREALTAADPARLERVFARLGALEDAEYRDWTTISSAGAQAARAADMDGVRKACQDCHRAYRPAYRRDHRPRPFR